ncbi:MAG: hypothetical protein L0I76_30665 [Pseudonocardia sp.]|nr:hypothetical protein [Pseudonocardia sp.]
MVPPRPADPIEGPTELKGVELGLQRACGIGLIAFAVQAFAVAIAGAVLYPSWWFIGPAAVVIATTAVTIVRCLTGRSRTVDRLAAVGVDAIGCVLTATATADTVGEVGNAMSPLVTAMVILLGLLDRPLLANVAGALLITAQLGAVALTRPLGAGDVLVVASIQAAVMLSATLAGRAMRRLAADQDHAETRLVRALSADRVLAATRADRREQDRELHDTVLSTLTSLARGSLVDDPRLRARCGADARYLRSRGLQRTGDDINTADLTRSLHDLARTHARAGFDVRVNVCGSETGLDLPDRVARALIGAAREAVTNAVRHSRADAVEVRAVKGDDTVLVEVVDHGTGASPAADQAGLGISRSIIERMADVGGAGTVEHHAGTGTRVTLTWPH